MLANLASSFHIRLAARALHRGEVIAYPTESVYGLGCDPNNLDAIEQLLLIKSRSAAKGLILIASDISQLEPWVDFSQVPDMQLLVKSWPGAETWIVPARKHISPLLTGSHNTLAVRVTAHPIASSLCQQFKGPITSTSANRNGQREASDLFTARQFFNDKVNHYLPGIISGNNNPSRIRNALNGQTIRA